MKLKVFKSISLGLLLTENEPVIIRDLSSAPLKSAADIDFWMWKDW